MTRFGWVVNIKLIQVYDESNKWAGSLINWCSPWLHVKTSSLDPSFDVLSLLQQVWVLVWKSPRTTVNKGIFFTNFVKI